MIGLAATPPLPCRQATALPEPWRLGSNWMSAPFAATVTVMHQARPLKRDAGITRAEASRAERSAVSVVAKNYWAVGCGLNRRTCLVVCRIGWCEVSTRLFPRSRAGQSGRDSPIAAAADEYDLWPSVTIAYCPTRRSLRSFKSSVAVLSQSFSTNRSTISPSLSTARHKNIS